ncbi:hypothetical protein SAMN02745165_02942 [Malonomonas rubra DSM 5091]|uniref:Uncharacterized protein n=1 Tax=Malonomonas rubra DSM 5091 TaxID=1122189 RepID=A0A1M6LAZ9_MALRU|nr:hypothetical protein [Malonomonas rubra]SHJ68368.1 hypothetical protein SAMN02745165_02942 [Malonomonas rubra DSM 5091]
MDILLEKSLDQYRQIIEHAGQLEQLLSNGDPEQLRQYTMRLNQLQEEAGLHDQQLLAEIARDSARWQAHPLFQQRMQLLEQIMEMNNLLLPRIHGMMAVTGAELAQLKEGRTALSGYHPNAGRPKKSIRGVG